MELFVGEKKVTDVVVNATVRKIVTKLCTAFCLDLFYSFNEILANLKDIF